MKKKLKLDRQTIRVLAGNTLSAAVGGVDGLTRDVICRGESLYGYCPTDPCPSEGCTNTCDGCTLATF